MREDHQKTIDGYKEAVSSINQKLHALSENNDLTVAENDGLKQEVIRLNDNHQAAARNAETKIEILRAEGATYGEETKNSLLSAAP